MDRSGARRVAGGVGSDQDRGGTSAPGTATQSGDGHAPGDRVDNAPDQAAGRRQDGERGGRRGGQSQCEPHRRHHARRRQARATGGMTGRVAVAQRGEAQPQQRWLRYGGAQRQLTDQRQQGDEATGMGEQPAHDLGC